ncbi:MAG: adenosyl-hopene transferase HpnH [Candidatus Acidiferrales bacterium]|jgi:hopanoid biosynthesis associated radical SAM protein HpnH
MRFPLSLTASLTGYLAGKKIRGEEKFPLVMMLEPLHACNLTCTGCGRIREYKSTINEMLTVEQCIAALEDCGSPIVSICGGEPMIYPEIGRLTSEILKRKKHIYLCTNGMFIRKRLNEFKPTSRFFFNVHLDGLEKTHDLCVEKDGVFREAIDGIKAAKAAGFLVCSNTTIYKETDLEEIAELFEVLRELGVDGYMMSPAYSYAAVQTKDIFMSREEVREKFQRASQLLENFNVITSPIYMEYLRGERELMCTAWGNPTYNPRGWKGPCYLMTDAHHATFKEFIDNTPWEKYGRGRDPRCQDCMVQSGYEPSAVLGGNKKLGDTWKMLKWQLSGRMGGAKGAKSNGKVHANGNGNGHSNGNSNGHSNGHHNEHSTSVPIPGNGAPKEEVFRIL